MARRTAQRGRHTHTREPIRLHDPGRPPGAWTVLLTQALGASPSLATRLWRLFRRLASSDDIGVIVRAQTRRDRQATAALLAVMTPKRFFELLLTLSPEGGPEPRDTEILALETTIMHRARGPHTWR